MKLKILALLAVSCGLSTGAVILEAKISSPVDNASNPLAGGTPALILVDINGAGIPTDLNEQSSVTTGSILSSPSTGGNYYVAALGFSTNDLFGAAISVTSGSIDLGSTPVATGQSYYAAWFPDRPGTDPTNITPGEFFEAQSATDWVIPGDGGSTQGLGVVPASNAIVGVVVPEPASAMLLGLGALALMRRRR